MAIIATLGILIGFGIVPFPFFDKFSEKQQIAVVGSVPCPINPAKHVSPEKIELTLLNGTDQTGLARRVKAEMEDRGFVVTATDNTPSGEFTGSVLIRAGALGVNRAYTVSEAFSESTIEFDSRQNTSVTITFGERFDNLIDADQFAAAIRGDIKPRTGCLPVSLGDD